MKAHLVTLALLTYASAARAETYYVATTGSDTNAGTEAAPFASWAKAESAAAPGDTVYFRGGRYRYSSATSDCGGSTSATVNAIVLSKSGQAGKPIQYWAYPGETPVFDFSAITDMSKYNCRQTGVRITASYLHLKGLEFTGTLQLNNLNHESWCVYVYGGNHNLFELLDAHHNMGPGFFLQRGSDNTFLNCDSHENEDTLTSNGDGQSADGFGCHPNRAGDTGNVFRGCRAYWNSDDGWDFINATEACTVEHSWAWYNGYKPDAVNNGQVVSLSAGNGNGFKGGGYGLPASNVPSPTPQHVLRFNLAIANKASGFYANHSPSSPLFQNNTGYKNGVDFNMLGVGSDGSSNTSVGVLRNNIGFGGTIISEQSNGGPIDSANNSWDIKPSLMVTDADFQSTKFGPPASCPEAYKAGGTVCVKPNDMTSFGGLASARQADGSLPVLPLMHLAQGSALVDKGVDVGAPFVGKAPDLGAFELGADQSTTMPAAGSGGMMATAGMGGAGAAAAGSGAPAAGSGGSGGMSGTLPPGSSTSAGRAAMSGDAGKLARGEAGSAGVNAPPASAAGSGEQASAAGHNGCGCQIERTSGHGSRAALIAIALLACLRSRRARPRKVD